MTLKEEIVMVAPSMLWRGVSAASRGCRERTRDGAGPHRRHTIMMAESCFIILIENVIFIILIMVNVAIAGGRGAVGRTFVEVMAAQAKHKAIVLTRKVKGTSPPPAISADRPPRSPPNMIRLSPPHFKSTTAMLTFLRHSLRSTTSIRSSAPSASTPRP